MIRKIISSVYNQFVTPPVFNTSLNDLPSSVIERIFSYLTYEEVVRTRVISRYLYKTVGEYIRQAINKLRNDLGRCIEETYTFLLSEGTNNKDKINALSVYNIYKILESEMDIICTMNRHILQNKELCLPLGTLLDMFYLIFTKTQKEKGGACNIYKEYNNQFYNEVKVFLHNMESDGNNIFNFLPLGVQAIDLMDLLLEAEYKFTVIYRVRENICHIRGLYTINRAKLLNYFPQLPQSSTNRPVTLEEAQAITKYLSVLLQVHNRLNIEEDFGWLQIDSELEALRYTHEIKQTIAKISEKYTLDRKYTTREVVDIKKAIIKENYIRESKVKDETSKQGLIFKVNLTCTIDGAPILIKKGYNQLKRDVEDKHISVKMINPKAFENRQQTTFKNTYGLLLYLKIWYSPRFKNVFPKDTVEYYFNDGNTAQEKL